MDIKYSYYVSSKGFKIVGGTADGFQKADGSVDNNRYVTINTTQDIIAQKTFTQSPIIPDGTVGNHAVNVNQLNSALTGSVPKSPILLGTSDLNTILIEGFYNQTSDANSTTARNYPVNNAGVLKVYKTVGGGLIQEYTAYHTATTYTRRYFSGNWGLWKNVLYSNDLLPYIPISQKGVANGVPNLDANIQIPNAQVPTRLLNKVIALGGEGGVDTTFTGLYDRNQLTLADKDHSVTTVLNGAGSFGTPLAAFNSTIFNAKSDFAIINGADATTELVITVNLTSTLAVYSRGLWQPFIQSRLQNDRMFRDASVEVMDNLNVWYPAVTVTNMVQIAGSGLYLFPESGLGTTAIKAVRFKLSNVLTFNGVVYLANIGLRHIAHSFAPQFPHRGENNQFYGVNTFNASPRVPNATASDQAVNFGQISSFVSQTSLNTQLGNYATLNSVQTFTNTKTFLQSPVIPNPTLLPHAVNLGYIENNFVKTPDGFAVLLNSGTNLNANLKTGFYRGEQLVNAPNNNVGWWFITVETHDNTWVTQKAVSFGAANVGTLIYQRNLSWDGWSNWEQVWTSKQFTQTNINKWNASIEKNQIFSEASGLELMMSDKNFDEEAGLVDAAYEAIIAGEENGFWKFGSNIGGINGILIEKNTRRIGYGGVQPSGIYEHNFSDKVFVNGSITSAGGFIHNDYNSSDYVNTSDGGVAHRTEFGGTTVKYIEVLPGDSFTPTRGAYFNIYMKDFGKVYLDSTGFDDGQIVTTFNKPSGSTQIWGDGVLKLTISGNKSNKFMKTSDGWMRIDEFGNTTFI